LYDPRPITAEDRRLVEDARREQNWKRWGPFLADRQWGTVREDYSADGDFWRSFGHAEAASRVYRWGEDGLLGLADRECRLCFALALWNGRDSMLKERLFGIPGRGAQEAGQLLESYACLDATPTHSYLKAVYRYPQAAFPYQELTRDASRSTGGVAGNPAWRAMFANPGYFEVFVEYCKSSPNDILIRLTVYNRAHEAARLHLLPSLWFRNTWSWGGRQEGSWIRPRIEAFGPNLMIAEHDTLGRFQLAAASLRDQKAPQLLFTENETNYQRLYGGKNCCPYGKDAFHQLLIEGRTEAVNPACAGTKAAFHYDVTLAPNQRVVLRLRLSTESDGPEYRLSHDFDPTFDTRQAEADEFYASRTPSSLTTDEVRLFRQSAAHLLWSQQFYYYGVRDWLEGDPAQPVPPVERKSGRNADWPGYHLRDVVAVPDKWRHPRPSAVDMALLAISTFPLDPELAREQLILFLKEGSFHANGQIPAAEESLGEAVAPLHAWACFQVYLRTGPRGGRDRRFLARAFQKLLIHFTWWMNRHDASGRSLLEGGKFSVRSLAADDAHPGAATRARAEDATAWMAFYVSTMLAIALELAEDDPTHEDVAIRFLDHFVALDRLIHPPDGTGPWNEQAGFYIERGDADAATAPHVPSIDGLVPLFAVCVLDEAVIGRLSEFQKRMNGWLEQRRELVGRMAALQVDGAEGQAGSRRLFTLVGRERLERILAVVLDEEQLLSSRGVRTTSKGAPSINAADSSGEQPFSENGGPVCLPLNYLLSESLLKFHAFYGDTFRVECPTGSGRRLNLAQVAHELQTRMTRPLVSGVRGIAGGSESPMAAVRNPSQRGMGALSGSNGSGGLNPGAAHSGVEIGLLINLLGELGRSGHPAAPIFPSMGAQPSLASSAHVH
jgi:hypothetical protein